MCDVLRPYAQVPAHCGGGGWGSGSPLLTWNLGCPSNCPVPLPLMQPLSSKMLMNSRLWRLPAARSGGQRWGQEVGQEASTLLVGMLQAPSRGYPMRALNPTPLQAHLRPMRSKPCRGGLQATTPFLEPREVSAQRTRPQAAQTATLPTCHEVVGVVGGGDFDGPRPEAHVHQLRVAHDGDAAAVHGVHQHLAMQVSVPATGRAFQRVGGLRYMPAGRCMVRLLHRPRGCRSAPCCTGWQVQYRCSACEVHPAGMHLSHLCDTPPLRANAMYCLHCWRRCGAHGGPVRKCTDRDGFYGICGRYLGSSGCTATAVSPSIVSGRVVATTISPAGGCIIQTGCSRLRLNLPCGHSLGLMET